MVAYKKRDDLRNVINREQPQKSMLTEYFQMNSVNPFAHSFLYREFPEYYRWDRTKNGFEQIKERRLVYACPAEGERYYLCVLLNHVRGATSFDDLKTIGIALNSVHDFFMCVVVRHTNSLCSLSGYIFLYIVCFWMICFTYFVDTITNLIEHDYIFTWLYICHVPRGM
jgi:hypothetical protein